MRLVCPLCRKVITVADGVSGTATTCPQCQGEFRVPEVHTPQVAAVTAEGFDSTVLPAKKSLETEKTDPVPRLAVLTPPPQTAPDLPAIAASTPVGFHGFAIRQPMLEWVVRVALVLPLFLGLFSWSVSEPMGQTAYSQNAWQAAFGAFSSNPVAEETLAWAEGFKKHVVAAWWLLPYGIALTLGALLAWAELFIAKIPKPLHSFLLYVHTQRKYVLAVCVILAFLFLSFQALLGVGLEKAAVATAASMNEAAQSAATTPEKAQIAALKTGKDLGAFCVSTTTAFALVRLCQFIAFLAMMGVLLIDYRGSKPPVQIGAVW
jgi:hypothetical protein